MELWRNLAEIFKRLYRKVNQIVLVWHNFDPTLILTIIIPSIAPEDKRLVSRLSELVANSLPTVQPRLYALYHSQQRYQSYTARGGEAAVNALYIPAWYPFRLSSYPQPLTLVPANFCHPLFVPYPYLACSTFGTHFYTVPSTFHRT